MQSPEDVTCTADMHTVPDKGLDQMLRPYHVNKCPQMRKGQKMQMYCRLVSQRCQKASAGQQARSKDLTCCRLWPALMSAILQEAVSLEAQREGKHTAHVMLGFPVCNIRPCPFVPHVQ